MQGGSRAESGLAEPKREQALRSMNPQGREGGNGKGGVGVTEDSDEVEEGGFHRLLRPDKRDTQEGGLCRCWGEGRKGGEKGGTLGSRIAVRKRGGQRETD